MSTENDMIHNYVKSLNKYIHKGESYILIKDLISNNLYSKGCNASQIKLIQKKRYPKESLLVGRIGVDNKTVYLDSVFSKRYSRNFVKYEVIIKEFENSLDSIKIYNEKPLIESLEDDFSFFKDSSGQSYNVEMRGERNKENIIFNCNDIEKIFEMNSLCRNITDKSKNTYEYDIDFLFCKKSHLGKITKETYLTFKGLMKVIHNSKLGRAKEFENWLNEIIFASFVGDQSQKIKSVVNILNFDTKAIIKGLSKCSSDIRCLYLINTNMISVDNKKIYKFGFTKNLSRRLKEHSNTFGNEIKLVNYCLIDQDNLSSVEVEFKKSVSCFLYKSLDEKYKSQSELLCLDNDSKNNIKHIMKSISDKYSSDAKIIINDIKQIIEKERFEFKYKLLEKENTIISIQKDLEIKDKDIENLNLRLELANMKMMIK